jgi:F0F1-type ATP synthase membrane subunit a
MIAVLYYAAPNAKLPGFKWISPGSVLAVVVWRVGFGPFVDGVRALDRMRAQVEAGAQAIQVFDPFWFEGTPFAVNRVVFLMWAASALCLTVFLLGTRRRAVVPRGLQNVVEVGYLFVRNNIAIDIIGPNGVRYVPYLASLFFFIFFSNVFGILPGINFPTTSRMAIPAFLALLTWIIFVGVGI